MHTLQAVHHKSLNIYCNLFLIIAGPGEDSLDDFVHQIKFETIEMSDAENSKDKKNV